MRDNYKEICNDYEALKKEYYDAEKKEKVEIEGQEYFVPWLSMFPNQKDVKLALKLEIIEGRISNKDIITFSDVEGLSFEPNEIKLKDLQKKQEKKEDFLVTVFCSKSLTENVCVDVINKSGNHLIGKLNIAKNNEIYKLPIKIVKVFTDKGNGTNNKKTFEDLTPTIYKKIEQDLQNRYFSQALIELNFSNVEEITINIEEFYTKNVIDIMYKDDKTIQGVKTKRGFDKVLYEDYYKNFKGIVVFLSAIPLYDLSAGLGRPFPLKMHYLIISPDYVSDTLTIAHELGHTLGLDHSSLPDAYNKNKKTIEGSKIEDEQKEVRLKELQKIYPKFLFKHRQTDNIMEPDNGGYEQVSFWKWQWEKMQEEIKLYHNEK
ncbi:hypothetical protein [Capnocytophaga cynodegmi]|uniref:hypothetical protein n=1 Tax=Capnocytophaga cynodegmi TaxID=28189 RepID=UPI00385F3A3C